ncbi:MAG: hypothetical protein M1836_002917 [Candelina mexicana]|nr:MAG: hypothetical protein M1836_002917 [Candelina mexicana]
MSHGPKFYPLRAFMRAYNGIGADDNEDLCHKQQIELDYDDVEMRSDARSKYSLSADSHSSSLWFESRSISVGPEVADGPASTPCMNTEPIETIERRFDVTTAPSTVTLVALGLTEYAAKHKRAQGF